MPDGSLSILYSDPLGIYEPAVTYSLGSNVRFGDMRLSNAAELGEPSMSTVDVDDPGGIRNIVGLRAIVFKETAAASNNQIVLRGVIQDRTYKRSDEHSMITGADRLISVDIADYNWHLGARVFVDADAKRPAETPGDRIRWLLADAAHINLNDYGHVTYPTSPTLEATDYRGQRAKDLLADCAVEGQYNFWCDFNEAHGTPELFFMDPDSSDYVADLAVSNVLSDVDSVGTFAPYDAELRRSPSRITYGAYVAYSGGAVYVRDDTTGAQFAKIDQTAPMANVKSATRARRIGNKFLAKNNSESDRLSFDIKVPAAQVNHVRAGHLLAVRFSHLPGYEDSTWVRVLQRGVIQEDEGGEDYYRIHIEAVPSDATVTLAPVVKWVYLTVFGGVETTGDGLSIWASDDGSSWSEIVTAAELVAGTSNPPDASPTTVYGLVAVPEADWRHRYWRLRYEGTHGGGYYSGIEFSMLRLLSQSGSDSVCRLNTPTSGGIFDWWEYQDPPFTGDVPYSAANIDELLEGPGYYAEPTASERMGNGSFGLLSAVFAPKTIVATWDFDIGYEA